MLLITFTCFFGWIHQSDLHKMLSSLAVLCCLQKLIEEIRRNGCETVNRNILISLFLLWNTLWFNKFRFLTDTLRKDWSFEGLRFFWHTLILTSALLEQTGSLGKQSGQPAVLMFILFIQQSQLCVVLKR